MRFYVARSQIILVNFSLSQKARLALPESRTRGNKAFDLLLRQLWSSSYLALVCLMFLCLNCWFLFILYCGTVDSLYRETLSSLLLYEWKLTTWWWVVSHHKTTKVKKAATALWFIELLNFHCVGYGSILFCSILSIWSNNKNDFITYFW